MEIFQRHAPSGAAAPPFFLRSRRPGAHCRPLGPASPNISSAYAESRIFADGQLRCLRGLDFGFERAGPPYLKDELQQKLEEKQLYDDAWLQIKRQISWYRRQIRSMLLEMQEEGADPNVIQDIEVSYNEIAFQLRTYIDLQQMRTLLQHHSQLHSGVLDSAVTLTGSQNKAPLGQNVTEKTTIGSCTSEPAFAHYKYTNPLKKRDSSPSGTSFQKSVAEPTEPKGVDSVTGLQHVSIKQVLLAASERFRSHLPLEPRPMNWSDAVEAADKVRSQMHISQRSWSEACQILSREGAALCVLLTDQAIERPDNPARQPAAYFRGMVNKARAGELRLHNSIFGLIEQTKRSA